MKGLTTKQKIQLWEFADKAQMKTGSPVGDEIAFVTLMRICRDYVDKTMYPTVVDRDAWLIERLKKFRIRFYEKI